MDLQVPVRRLPPIREKAEKYTSPAIVQRELPRMWGNRVFTFTEIVELRFVAWCHEHGISVSLIRDITDAAIETFGPDHPLALQDFATDGYRVFALLKEQPSGEHLLARELPGAQYAFTSMIEPHLFRAFFKDLDYDAGWASRWWPQGRGSRVVIDPQRSFGKPIDDETGIRTDLLYRASLSGDTIEEVAEWYDVPISAVVEAIKYEELLGAA
ncbi:MAG: DUF433 domain-containing protein [Armatimonadetes bacterium]|nr:DUF433 domain-containing protein [Armatimonadota bacterium]